LTANFNVRSVVGGDSAVVNVFGEIDLHTAPRLADELVRAAGMASEILVDLEHVEFMDCAGLRVVVEFARAADAAELWFGVTPGPRQVRKLFELTEVGRWLHMVDLPAGLKRAA
jgi:anti-anti-sigma factor